MSITAVQPLLQDDGSPAPELDVETEKSRHPSRSTLKSLLHTHARLVTVTLLAAAIALVLLLTAALKLSLTSVRQHQSSSEPQSVQPAPYSDFVVGNIVGQPPQTRFYNFVVSELQGAPDGVEKQMLVVNGQYPGPTIEANQWDKIIVNVTNKLSNATTIHWHGLYQNQTNFYDGTSAVTECGIPPGQSLVYNFTLGEFSGTTWWHALDVQYTDGIVGALIVHSTGPAPPGSPTWDGDIVVQMSDLYHTFGYELLQRFFSPYGMDGTTGDEPVPDAGTLNGLGQWDGGGDYFNFSLEANKTYRLRLVNTGSFPPIRFSLDYHPLTVIEVEGMLVQPYTVSSLIVDVAQRYSVLIHTNQTEESNQAYWMRATLQKDMFRYDLPGQNLDIRGIVRYGPPTNSNSHKRKGSLPSATADPGIPGRSLGDMDTSLLVPAEQDIPPKRTRFYTVKVTLQKTNWAQFLAFMNGTSWEPLQGTTTLLSVYERGANYAPVGGSIQSGEQFLITEDDIQVVDLLIDNLDDGAHPFHIHGFSPYIMGVGRGRYIGQPLNEVNPIRRDTPTIPAYSWMIMRFVTDNPGLWAFHCHIAWHMAEGLFMQINSLPSQTAKLDIPQAIIDQCKASTP